MSEEEALIEQPVPVQYKSVVVIGGNAMFRSQLPVVELTEHMRGIMNTEQRVFTHRDDEHGHTSILSIPVGAMVEVMSLQRFEVIQNERRIAAMRQQAMQAPPSQIMRPRS